VTSREQLANKASLDEVSDQLYMISGELLKLYEKELE
jgi:hypothetical protein